MTNPKIIHQIDKRLAVLEALSREHFEKTEKTLERVEEGLVSMKVKVAGISAVVSLLIGALSIWLKNIL